jgi:hypothetical protein
MNDNNWDNTNYSKVTISGSENQGTNTTFEEDEAFKDLEKAIKNGHKATP